MVAHDKNSNAAIHNNHKPLSVIQYSHQLPVAVDIVVSNQNFFQPIQAENSDHNPNDHPLMFTDQNKQRKRK